MSVINRDTPQPLYGSPERQAVVPYPEPSAFRVGSLFSGAGGLDLGLHRAGLQTAWFNEIDPAPARILQHAWPHTPLYLCSVSELSGEELVRRHGPVSMIAGGSPCQGFSAAGLREGLDDHRSGLFSEQIRIWHETKAEFLLWENVVGAFTSNGGADFTAVLNAFVDAKIPMPKGGWKSAGVAVGNGGVVAWRVLDAQFMGVPQRRRRVFALVSRTGLVDPAEVLLEMANPLPLEEAGAAA